MERNDVQDLTRGGQGSASEPESTHSASTLDTIKTTVSDKLHTAAAAIRQRVSAPESQASPIASYASQASEWLDTSADYVERVDPQKIKDDIQQRVRRNPAQSLLIAGAAGLILGILLRRR
jgi:ElaB/YqjD/DUF883 family membrane-anchored ribosome-binding protein